MSSRSHTTFDLVLMQALNGAYLATIGEDIPASEALASLAGAAWAYRESAGTVPMLVPTTDPLHQVRREVARARALRSPMSSTAEAYDEIDGAVGRLRRRAGGPAIRAELIQIAAMAILAVEDLEL